MFEDFARYIDYISRKKFTVPFWMMRPKRGSTVTKISKYEPHQGKKECERRRLKMEGGAK